jgi:response regulator RpfG family c-di-GMP phosphodiesterase
MLGILDFYPRVGDNNPIRTGKVGGLLRNHGYRLSPEGLALKYKNYTCLVVEDNLSTLTMIVNMLANIGYQNVVTARNGREAWEKIQSPEAGIDIVLSDMLMPEEDGLQLLQRIRNSEEYWHLPFIMVTCVDDLDRIMSVTEEHIDAYLVKPVTEAVIRAKIYSAIKKTYDPDPYHQALFLGKKYLREGQYDSAIQSLEEARDLQPGQSATYFNLAQAMEKVGKMDEAEENYKRCKDCSNDLYVRSLDGLARVYQHRGDHASALEVLNKGIEISPNTADRHMDLAVELKAVGNTAGAKASLTRALRLSRKEAQLPQRYIEACLDLGMEKEAESIMQRNMSGDMEDIVLLNQMGIVCRRRKEYERARKYYRRALEIAPDDEFLNYNYAVLLVDLKEYKSARSHLYHVLRQNPDSENALSLIIKLDKREAS